MIKNDMQGMAIDVGDLVLYVAAGAGSNLPPMKFGVVKALTPAGITVQETDGGGTPKQRVKHRRVGTGRFRTDFYNEQVEIMESVEDGYEDVRPENIRFYKDRFFIVRKV